MKRLLGLALTLSACRGDTDGDIVPLDGEDITFDDLRYGRGLQRVIIAARDEGYVALVHPDTLVVTMLRDLPGDVSSADEADGTVVAVDRSGQLLVLDPISGAIVATAPTRHGPDYVRLSPTTHELWVTEPGGRQIEVFSFGADRVPVPVAVVDLASGPEGLAFDTTRNLAFAHHSGGEMAVIDVAAHTVVEVWPMNCASTHGIPTVDEARGLLFTGCNDTEVNVHDIDGGAVLDSYSLSGGTTLLAYSPELGHLYLRADPGDEVAVLAVSDAGELSPLHTFQAYRKGHCLVADDRGHAWMCDAAGGALVRYTDDFN